MEMHKHFPQKSFNNTYQILNYICPGISIYMSLSLDIYVQILKDIHTSTFTAA